MTNTLAVSPIGIELLDDPAADPALVQTSLANIARANRWFGGTWAALFGIRTALAGTRPGPLTLLDVGTGAGDLPRAAARWGSRRGWRVRAMGLDRSPVAAHLAQSHGVIALTGCAGTLPVRDASVDLVLVSQLLHHLAPPAASRLLSECARVARRAVIVSDLFRSRLAMLGFRLGSRALGFDPATRSDGLTSIRRGYRPDELGGLLHQSGLTGARLYRRPGYRVVAIWRRS